MPFTNTVNFIQEHIMLAVDCIKHDCIVHQFSLALVPRGQWLCIYSIILVTAIYIYLSLSLYVYITIIILPMAFSSIQLVPACTRNS